MNKSETQNSTENLVLFFASRGVLSFRGLSCKLLQGVNSRSQPSASLMGYQMAVAYTGTTFLPPLFGVIATQTSIALFPFAMLAFIVFMMLSAEKVNHILSNQAKSKGM